MSEQVRDVHIQGYELLERIGSGGFGAVYRARQSTIGREVAIKVILPAYANHPEFIRRFETEAHLVARLEHPHITPLHDYWRDPNGAYLVMRYLKGGSVRDALQDGAYTLEATVHLLDQIASALSFAHRNGVIHRDIKPGNILLDEDGNAYLADFGIAKDLTGSHEGQTSPDSVVGSLDYISPEQARNEPVTARTDIYSLGVTLYEMITGEHPFKTSSSVERLYHHINDPLPEIEDLPAKISAVVNEVIHRATEKDPAKRYADVLELSIAFHDALGKPDAERELSMVEQLTLREQEILQLIVEGRSNKEIADKLFVTVATVKWHIRQVYGKLGVRSRVQAIVRARELDLLVSGETTVDVASTTHEGHTIALPEPENPYKGLRAFQVTDARDFFGREDLIAKLVERMRGDQPSSRFLAVVGPSGSGKSSLVKAGLIPALWRGALPGSEKWFIVDMLPGTHPIEKLETALIRAAANQAGNLHEQLMRDERGLIRIADIILPDDKSQLVLIVDQFEEVFTLTEDEATRQHFLNLIHAAAVEPRSRVRIVITLRADYYDRPLHYPEFGEMLRNRMETILPLSVKGLERAIRGPAERVSVTFEQGLVEQIITRMNYQAGALPLLQYALTELFDRRQERLITQQAYAEIGGAVGALANRADELYRGLTDEGKALAKQMFLRLITLGEGAEDTRRRVYQSELLSLTENTDLMEEIIDQFTAYRLLSLDHDPATRQPVVEVAHEAILREWERLREWLNDSRSDIRQQRQVAQAAVAWKASDKDASYLLHGSRLEQAESWRDTTTLTLTPLEKEFLTISIVERTRQQQEKLEQQARENALEVRSRRILQVLVAVMTTATILGAGLAVFAFDRAGQAQREANISRSMVLANDAIQSYELGETDAALLLALESVAMPDPPPVAVNTLGIVGRGIGTEATLSGHQHSIETIATSNNNLLAASGSCALLDVDRCQSGEIIIWSLQPPQEQQRFATEQHRGWITDLSFSPDSRLLLSASEDGLVLLWDLASADVLQRFEGHEGAVRGIAYHPAGELILTGGEDGLVLLWEIASGEIVQRFEGHSGAVNAVSFNQDGSQLLSAGEDGRVIRWDTASAERLTTYEQTQGTGGGAFHSVAFYPAGNGVVASGFARYLWDLETAAVKHAGITYVRLHDLAITANGIFYDGYGEFVRMTSGLGNSADNATDRYLYDHYSEVNSLALTPDDRHLLTGAADGMLRVWVINAQLADTIAIRGRSARLLNSPDQRHILITTFGNMPSLLFDLETRSVVQQFQGDFPLAWAPAFSPDGRYLAIGYINFFQNDTDNSLILWDVETGEAIRRFEGHTIRLGYVQFTPDGRYLISASQNPLNQGELFMWDVASGELVRRFDTNESIAEIAISRDGTRLVSASWFGKNVTVWDLESGEVLVRRDFDTMVSRIQFAPSGNLLLIGLGDARLLEVELSTLETLRSFDGNDGLIWDLALSPDGRLLVSGQEYGTVIIWDYATGRELQRINHPANTTTHAIFHPDGRTLFLSAYQSEISEWYVSDQPLDELLTWVREQRYIREFTCLERNRYGIEPLCSSNPDVIPQSERARG
jgi:WD40 repeat protein/DNA-binding CsgD family transcriptional regulator